MGKTRARVAYTTVSCDMRCGNSLTLVKLMDTALMRKMLADCGWTRRKTKNGHKDVCPNCKGVRV